MINIQGIDKAALLAALYNNARSQGLGCFKHDEKEMSVEEARTVLEDEGPRFDYLRGRVMKVRIAGDEIEERLYDRDNGTGSVARIVDALRRFPTGG